MVINTYQELNDLLQEYKKRVYIAGAGNYGKILGDYFNQKRYFWAGFIDKSKRGMLCGKEIFPTELVTNQNTDYIFIAAISFSDEIYKGFIKRGINEEKLVVFEDSEVLLNILIEMEHLEKRVQNIEKFKNRYQGKRCFVIGNGPSLTEKHLDCLKSEVTFASNSIYAMYEHSIWRPTYYGIYDSIATKTIFSSRIRERIVGSCETIFCALSHWNILHPCENKIDSLCFFKDICSGHYEERSMKFSNDVSKKVYCCSTITYILLQLAVYMGFRSIYLLGADFTFSAEKSADGSMVFNDVKNHNSYIEEEEKKEIYDRVYDLTGYNYLAEKDYQLWGYQAARKYADSHGIKIYNATRGGKLEVFERVDFDSLF